MDKKLEDHLELTKGVGNFDCKLTHSLCPAESIQSGSSGTMNFKVEKSYGMDKFCKEAAKNSLKEKVNVCPTRKLEKSLKSRRKSFSLNQLLALEYQYAQNRYTRGQNRAKLARELELTEIQVKIWFQNRRAKDNRNASPMIKSVFGKILEGGEFLNRARSLISAIQNEPADS